MNKKTRKEIQEITKEFLEKGLEYPQSPEEFKRSLEFFSKEIESVKGIIVINGLSKYKITTTKN